VTFVYARVEWVASAGRASREGDPPPFDCRFCGFAGARDGGNVKFRLAVLPVLKLWFGFLVHHPVTQRIGPWAPVASSGHEQCNGGEAGCLPCCKFTCMYLFVLACWCLHAEGPVPVFVLLSLCNSAWGIVCPQIRDIGKTVFVPCFCTCRSCRSYCLYWFLELYVVPVVDVRSVQELLFVPAVNALLLTPIIIFVPAVIVLYHLFNHICAGGKCSIVNSYNYICADSNCSILLV
jgi:hypothetical protein